MIPAGTTSVSFDISIVNDKVLEVNEYFTLSINSFHLPNVTITNHQARVTIVDNDCDMSNVQLLIHYMRVSC